MTSLIRPITRRLRVRVHAAGAVRCQHLSTVISIPKADVFRFGTSVPALRAVEWTVNQDESWAIIGANSATKSLVFQMLLGHMKIDPYPPLPGGLYPFLTSEAGPSRDTHDAIAFVSFSNRRRASGGAFYDYSARYGAVQEEDRVTLRQSMFPETMPLHDLPPEVREFVKNLPHAAQSSPERTKLFHDLAKRLGLESFLDLPLIALSNGQTRRARILKAVLSKPDLLLLDEPLTGLDVDTRPILLDVLHSLHKKRSPAVVLGLRVQDPIPEWITHVALVGDGTLKTGEKGHVLAVANTQVQAPMDHYCPPARTGAVVADLRNVLKNLNWQIREGERWHLHGPNGSGKTTLMAMLTGDHPQSYTQLPSKDSHLHLFARPRGKIPTPQLQSLIGLVSPELFDAFPRRANMTVWKAIGTGFDGNFVPRGTQDVGVGVMEPLTAKDVQHRVSRMWDVLRNLGPAAWQDGESDETVTQVFSKRLFVDLSIAEQRIVLLMRALVGGQRLVLLDEVWSGMDERMVKAARRYLRNGAFNDNQAIVVISHWDDEVPWSRAEGLKKLMLKEGEGTVKYS